MAVAHANEVARKEVDVVESRIADLRNISSEEYARKIKAEEQIRVEREYFEKTGIKMYSQEYHEQPF